MSEDRRTAPPAAQRAGAGGEGLPRFVLPVYEGPLDLLLHLVKKAELDARDVTASIITEQYLKYLEMLEALNLDIAGEYLVMAATLLLIKSFTMLPHAESGDAEEAEQLKEELIERLLEYQRYREAAEKLAARPLLGRDVFAAPGEPEGAGAEPPRYAVSVFDLVEAMGAVLKRLKDQTPRDIRLRDIPVAECIPRILSALADGARVEFIRLFDDLPDRPLVIASFMALLELIKQGRVRAFQERRGGPIWLERGAAGGKPSPAPIRQPGPG